MDYITIGKVANAHGTKGDLKIFPTTDDITRFKKLKTVTLEFKNKEMTLNITGIKYSKNMVILTTKEISDMDTALSYKNASILVPMEDALPLAENENFIFQLIGLEAREEGGEVLGKLKDVLTTGAHDVYVIDDGSKHGLMIPATLEFVPEVNVEEGYLVVRLIEGLRDLSN